MQLEPVTVHVTEDAVQTYARLTDDFNPIHLDAAFAAATPMQHRIAHGTLSLGALWQALAGVPTPGAGGWELDIRFLKPVRLGDRVTAGGGTTEPGRLEVWVRNDRGETVIAGTARQR